MASRGLIRASRALQELYREGWIVPMPDRAPEACWRGLARRRIAVAAVWADSRDEETGIIAALLRDEVEILLSRTTI